MNRKILLFLCSLIVFGFIFMTGLADNNVSAQQRRRTKRTPTPKPTPTKPNPQENVSTPTPTPAPVNEPTLEETLNFINDKLQQNVNINTSESSLAKNKTEMLKQRVIINGSRMVITYEEERLYEYKDGSFKAVNTRTGRYEIFIEDLDSDPPPIREYKEIVLFTLPIFGRTDSWQHEEQLNIRYIREGTESSENKVNKSKETFVYIYVSTKEMAERLQKAFTHLIKLLKNSKKEPF